MADDILEIIELGLTLRLVEKGIEQRRAERIVGDYIEELRESYGGARYSVKRGYRKYSPAMIVRIRSQYNGRNAEQLRARYGMSRSSFHRLIQKKSR